MNIPILYKNAEYKDLDPKLEKIVSDQFSAGKGVYLHGPAGTGKTYTAYAIAKEVEKRGYYAIFYKVNKLMHYFRDIEREKEVGLLDSLISGNSRRDYLFLDDLGANKETEYSIDCLTMILDYRYENLLPVLITSNASMVELQENVGGRVYSRLIGMCQEVKIDGRDRRIEEV